MTFIAEKSRIKVNLIAFLILAVGLLYAMATQVLTILQPRYTVNAIFPDAGGVFTNQEVTYRGITVGQVGDMRVVDEGVEIELLITKGVDVPKEDVEARVMFKSAVGEQFVDLLPASEGEPFLADGDTIPIEQTSIPVSTQELLSVLEAVLRGVPPEDLKGAVDALGIGLTGTGPDIATIIESLADLSELFADRAPEFEGILRQGTRVGDAFLRSKEDFATAIHELVPVAETLAASTENIERLMRNANLTSDEVIALMRADREEIEEFLIAFGEVNALQADHADDLLRLFEHLPRALARVNKTFEPTTGLVRFGLVTDSGNQPCSYGRKRKSPNERNTGPPPKNLSCGQSESAGTSLRAPVGGAGDGTTEQGVGFLPGFDPTTLGLDSGPSLPARMADWSWTLFYLNGI